MSSEKFVQFRSPVFEWAEDSTTVTCSVAYSCAQSNSSSVLLLSYLQLSIQSHEISTFHASTLILQNTGLRLDSDFRMVIPAIDFPSSAVYHLSTVQRFLLPLCSLQSAPPHRPFRGKSLAWLKCAGFLMPGSLLSPPSADFISFVLFPVEITR